MLTVFLLLAILSLICTVASAAGQCPLWVPVLLLTIMELLRAIPLGR